MGKSKKKDDGGGDGVADLGLDDKPKLQAVLLADSFLSSFQPLSLDLPKVLCPLNNAAILDYAMDFLAGNGVEEVYVVCTKDALEKQLARTTTWQGRMSVHCIKDTSLTNAGDALRELYKRNLIKSDPFVLLFGDVVTNVDLSAVLEAHQKRHKADSSAIMTLVLNPTGSSSRIRSATDDLFVGFDPSRENRVLLYDNHASKASVSLPCSFFAAHPGIEVRTDLTDTGLFVCSPDVLGRFEDEFDYLDIQQDFVTNCVAEEEEGLQTRIHAHVLGPGEYAARIVDLATYHAVSGDLLRRWCYPIVPDHLHSTPRVYYKASVITAAASSSGSNKPTAAPSSPRSVAAPSSYLYRETLRPTRVDRSSTLDGPGMLGSGGTVGEDAVIRSTVVGNGVTVGKAALVEDSHLWDGATIGPNARVSFSILAKNCVVGEGAVVPRGCVIGEGCVIGAGVVLPEFTRITLVEEEEDPFADDSDSGADDWGDDDDDDRAAPGSGDADAQGGASLVGPDGKGRVWQPSADDEDDDSDEDDDEATGDGEKGGPETSLIQLQSMGMDLEAYYQHRLRKQADKEPEDDFSTGAAGQDDEEAERMESEAFAAYTEGTFTFENTSSGGAYSSGGGGMVVGRQKGVDVVKELKEICMEFEDDGNSPWENLSIELNSYKFSQNATYSDCTMGSMLAILEKLRITPETKDGKLVAGFKQKLAFWAPLLQKMSIGQPEEIAIIHGLERAATATTSPKSTEKTGAAQKLSSGVSFRFLLQTMHDEEVLSEEAILAWAEERKSEPEDSPLGKLFQMESVQDFLEWLEEEEESDSEDDDDEDSD